MKKCALIFLFILISTGCIEKNYNIDKIATNKSDDMIYYCEKSVILRLDDVRAWDRTIINITDSILAKNLTVTLAVMPKDIDRDPIVKNYLLNLTKNANIEIAQHGTYHKPFEFQKLNESDSYSLTKIGLEEIIDNLNIYPVTFIPPNNAYNNDTAKALSKLGFKIISSTNGEFRSDKNMIYIGADIPTKYWDKKELTKIDDILNYCNKSIKEKNVCVITIHPSDYKKEDGETLDENKYKEFIELLDKLKTLNVRFVKFNDMINCVGP